MKILVCGGAGYVGSHCVRELLAAGHKVIVYDNLSTGHQSTVPDAAIFVRGDIKDGSALDSLFSEHSIYAVMHFCASIVVSESCLDPLSYFDNNVSGSISLLQAMQRASVKIFIFSSTAALFGMPQSIPIMSADLIHPINPYGHSKAMIEEVLRWCDTAYGIKHLSLRYFNACGAAKGAEIGEDHAVETHLIPLVLKCALGQLKEMQVFGSDWDTPDGSCVRDYVHVCDLASAHLKALEYLTAGGKSDSFNLGSGKGFSVLEILDAARKLTGHPIPAVMKERRDGDAAILVASSDKAEQVLGWKRQWTDINDIISSAWEFHKKHPHGFT